VRQSTNRDEILSQLKILCAFGFHFFAPLREMAFSQRRKVETEGAKNFTNP